MTGWGMREILEEVPFATGLQLIFCDDIAHGHKRTWNQNRRATDVDALTAIEDALNAKV